MPVTPMRSWTLALLLVAAPLGASQTEPGAEARARLAELLGAGAGTTDEAFLRDARERASFCIRCHGEDGNSVMPLVPNLAGQNAYYLLEQIGRFASGRRADYIMTPLARRFAPDDVAVVALYFSRQRPRPYAADPDLQKRGEARFRERCVACHGHDARGGERYARLAGQRPEYLRHRLYQFQGRDTAGETPGVMSSIARTLSDEDVEALAAYLASLP